MARLRPLLFALLFLPLLARTCAAYAPHSEVVAGPVTGQVTEILDGDTVTVRLHVWIGEEIQTSVRIAGIDAPEIHGKCEKERRMAQEAKSELAALLSDSAITLYDIRLEKYAGRVLASARNGDGTDISGHMLDKGLARAYGGEKRKPWCS
jgi:endonuclease YncB( thermonuclease family)